MNGTVMNSCTRARNGKQVSWYGNILKNRLPLVIHMLCKALCFNITPTTQHHVSPKELVLIGFNINYNYKRLQIHSNTDLYTKFKEITHPQISPNTDPPTHRSTYQWIHPPLNFCTEPPTWRSTHPDIYPNTHLYPWNHPFMDFPTHASTHPQI